MKITFIGLGKMGTAMATRILEAGESLTVYNRTKNKAKLLEKKGAKPAESIKDAVSGADIIISCLLDDKAVIETTLGNSGILQHMKTSAIHVGTATILPKTAEALYEAHQQHGSQYVSAAVLGVPGVALAGKLTTFCSGNVKAITSCENILKTFSEAVINLGEKPIAATATKIGLNYCLASTLEIISELYVFFEKSGLNLEIIQESLHQVYGHPAFKRYIDKIKNRDFDNVNFDMKGGFKDISIFQEAFTDAQVVPRLGNLLKSRYISALASGMDNKDWSAIYEIVRKESGLN